MKIELLHPDSDLNDVTALIKGYQYNDFKTYRIINKEHKDEYLLRKIFELKRQRHSWVLIAKEDNKIAGLISLNLLKWDTKHFGVKMGKISHIISAYDYEEALRIKNELLKPILKICRKEHFAYLSCKVDVEDLSSVHVLEESGFKIMETVMTFAFKSVRHKIPNIRTIYRVRKYKSIDLPFLMEIARTSFLSDRFHLDNLIPKEKTNSLYSEWIKNSSSTDTVFVATSKNKPVGFFTYRLYEDLANISGFKIMGNNGLMAVSSCAKGAIIGLMKATFEDVISNYDCVEYHTQISNREVMRLFQKFNLDFVRAKYTFHKWM